MYNHSNKSKGYQGEDIVADYYQSLFYTIKNRNYTIPGGEVDIIVENANEIVFVEVKVVDNIDDLYAYISPRKISLLERVIEDYIYKNNIEKTIRLDVVFVQNHKIIEVYTNVSNN